MSTWQPVSPARVAREALAARARGRRHHGASLGQRLEGLYTAALAVAIIGSMALSGTSSVLQGQACPESGPAPGRCLSPAGRPALGLSLALVGFGLLVRAGTALGPVAASRAEAAWLLSTPADRRTLLLPSLARALAAGAVAGGLVGALALVAAHPRGGALVGMTPVAIAGAALGVALAGALAVAQIPSGGGRARGPGRAPQRGAARVGAARRTSAVLGWTAVAAGVVCAGGALVPVGPAGGLPALAPAGAWAASGAAVVLAGAATALAVHRVGRGVLPELCGAGELQSAVLGAVVALDTGVAGGALAARSPRRGRVRSRRGRGSGLRAVTLRDGQRLLRHPGVLLAAAGLVVLPAVALALGGALVGTVVAVLGALVVARASAGGLRSVAGSPGLARALPFTTPALRGALLVVPGAVALVWSVAATAVLGAPATTALGLALAGLAGAARALLSAGGAGSGPVVVTAAGPVPLGLLARVVRGPDVALVSAVPLLLGAGPDLAVVVPAVVGTVVVCVGGRRP